jgi:CubicO group peptidase (beta-lactamase class C family)
MTHSTLIQGDNFMYNNSGYFLLGYIIEKVAGKPYPEYLKEIFFEPLGMKNTGIYYAGIKLENEAKGYSGNDGKAINWDMSWAGGAGAAGSRTGAVLEEPVAVGSGGHARPAAAVEGQAEHHVRIQPGRQPGLVQVEQADGFVRPKRRWLVRRGGAARSPAVSGMPNGNLGHRGDDLRLSPSHEHDPRFLTSMIHSL